MQSCQSCDCRLGDLESAGGDSRDRVTQITGARGKTRPHRPSDLQSTLLLLDQFLLLHGKFQESCFLPAGFRHLRGPELLLEHLELCCFPLPHGFRICQLGILVLT